MTVLVLSSTGNTGRATVSALLARGANVRAATRSPERATFGDDVEVVRFDLLDSSTWEAALTGVDAMYYCLSTTLTGALEESLALIDAAVAHGVRRIVQLSAFRADNIAYAPHKRLEAAVKASGVRWVILRPNFFADNLINYLTPDNQFMLPAGKGRTSFIAVSDIGAAAAEGLLGEAHGKIWTLTGGQALDHYEVADILTDTLQRPVRYLDIPARDFSMALAQYGGVDSAKAAELARVLSEDVSSDLYAPVHDDFERVMGRPAATFREWAESHASTLRP